MELEKVIHTSANLFGYLNLDLEASCSNFLKTGIGLVFNRMIIS